MHTGNPEDLNQAQANPPAHAPQGVPTVDVTEAMPPHAPSEAQQFFTDAVFAVQNNNVLFLSLLLGRNKKEQKKDDAVLSRLADERIKLKAIHAGSINEAEGMAKKIAKSMREADTLDASDRLLEKAEAFLADGGIQRRMAEAHIKDNESHFERAKEHDRDFSKPIVNGREQEQDPLEREAALKKYQDYVNMIQAGYLAAPATQKKIVEKTKRFKEKIDDFKVLILKERAAGEAVIANNDQSENIKKTSINARDAMIKNIIAVMGENRQDMSMPEKYKNLHNQAENKPLKELLVRAFDARVNVRQLDQDGNSLLYYALQNKKTKLDTVKLLMEHGAEHTAFIPEDPSRWPYHFVMMHGNNAVRRLILSYSVSPGPVQDQNAPGYYNKDEAVNMWTDMLEQLCDFFREILDKEENSLPNHSEIMYSSRFIQQQKNFYEKLRKDVLPRAVYAKSWAIFEDEAKQIISAIEPQLSWWMVEGKVLKQMLEKHLERGQKIASKYVSVWHLLAQLQIANKALHEAQANRTGHPATAEENVVLQAELVIANEREQRANQVVASLTAENQALVAAQTQSNLAYGTERQQYQAQIGDLFSQNQEISAEKTYWEKKSEQWERKNEQWERKNEQWEQDYNLTKKQVSEMVGLIQDLQRQINEKNKPDIKPQSNTDDAPRSPRSTPGYDAQQGRSQASNASSSETSTLQQAATNDM